MSKYKPWIRRFGLGALFVGFLQIGPHAPPAAADEPLRPERPLPTKPYLQNPAPENPTRVESQQREQYRDRIESDAFRQERGDSLRAPDRTSPRQIDRQRSLRGERGRLNRSPIR